MLRRKRLFISTLVIPLIMACVFLLPATPITTTPSPGVSITEPIFTPSATIPQTFPIDSAPSLVSFQPVTRIKLDSSERILKLVAEADDVIWLLTDHRVMLYSRGTWTDYLAQFKGTIIDMDSHHHVWVVSDDRTQVSFWDGATWTSLGTESGWEPPTPDNSLNLNWSLDTDTLDQVWLSTNQDVRMFDGINWKVFTLDDLGMSRPELEDALPETIITILKNSGCVWALSCHWIGPGPIGGGGVRWYDGQAWNGVNSPVAHGCATTINEDIHGNIWVGLDSDLWKLDPLSGNWEQFPAPKPPMEDGWFGFFSNIAMDAFGNPWPELVVCGGASCYTGNIRYRFTGTEWIQIGDIGLDNGSLYFDTTGQGWVFTPQGVSRIEENQLEPIAEISILKVSITPIGRLWILGAYKGETALWAQVPDN